MWKDQIEKLQEVRRTMEEGGGRERVRKQHEAGKLTAAERLELLLDKDSFVELRRGMMTDVSVASFKQTKAFYGDGVLTGWGLINGRRVCVAAEDFTVIGGTLGKVHAEKIARLQDMALQMRVPVIFLNDSGGARIEEGINSLSGYGEIFQRHVRASGVIPQICAILGPCSGGACYSPALCDFIFLVRDTSKMFITGPAVVESVLGKRPTFEELGGAVMHSEKSGVAHALYNDEVSCLLGIRKLLSYLPDSADGAGAAGGESGTASPADDGSGGAGTDLAGGSAARDTLPEPAWQEIVPDDARKTYDMHQVIRNLVDSPEDLFEIHKHFACNVITGFTHLGGRTVGVVANQPDWLGGALDCDGSDKAARFIRFCDCFGIPLLTLVDVPAFMPGIEQEQKGIIRHGAKLLYAYSEATVPKITVLLRKAFGGAYIAMNSKTMGADLVYAWPIAQVAVMGAEGAVEILCRRTLNALEDPQERARKAEELKNDYESRYLNPRIAMEKGYVDEVILPEETRAMLVSSFAFLEGKKAGAAGEALSGKKHGNMPV